jgi:predicted signal transduction protein with EAL and GGDEF domain
MRVTLLSTACNVLGRNVFELPHVGNSPSPHGRVRQCRLPRLAPMRERQSIEHKLRGALSRGEIDVHYQPEFDLQSGRMIRFEALARWSPPVLGNIPPQTFIPVAEESGLIVALGSYIRRACIEAANGSHKASRF